ncbi:hypothetical protein VULLAG_LOCUS20418 [Vulpes lagopus]
MGGRTGQVQRGAGARVWGRSPARRGRRARVPPPAQAASRREQHSQPCRGSSRQLWGPSARSRSSAACATRRRRRPAAAARGPGATAEQPGGSGTLAERPGYTCGFHPTCDEAHRPKTGRCSDDPGRRAFGTLAI